MNLFYKHVFAYAMKNVFGTYVEGQELCSAVLGLNPISSDYC